MGNGSKKAKLDESDFPKLNDYMKQCKGKLIEGTLEKEKLENMKMIVTETNTYNHVVIYANACIRFDELQEAIDTLSTCVMNHDEKFSQKQKDKLQIAISKIKKLKIEREAASMLSNGKGVIETAKQTELSIEKIMKLQKQLKSKSENNPPRGRGEEK